MVLKSRILPLCLVAILAALAVIAAVDWNTRRLSTIQRYQNAFGLADRVVVKGVRAQKDTGHIVSMECDVTNPPALLCLSNAFFDVRRASERAKFSYSPPIAGTRLHLTVRGYSGSRLVFEFETVGSHRVFFNENYWLDLPEVDLPDAIRRVCELAPHQ